jgi:hypothetical protein
MKQFVMMDKATRAIHVIYTIKNTNKSMTNKTRAIYVIYTLKYVSMFVVDLFVVFFPGYKSHILLYFVYLALFEFLVYESHKSLGFVCVF